MNDTKQWALSQPDGEFFAPQRGNDRSSPRLRQALGYVGFFLPGLVYVFAAWRSVGGFPGWKPLDSLSEYYYSGSVAILTGALGAIAAFLFTYQGYTNPYRRWDVLTGKVAGVAALGVALFPTESLSPFEEPPWWVGWIGKVHLASACLLFACLIVFSVFLFPISDAPSEGQRADRRVQNPVYRLCGAGMAGLLIWAGVALQRRSPIFFQESLALMLFGISWLTKGRAAYTLRKTAGAIAKTTRAFFRR